MSSVEPKGRPTRVDPGMDSSRVDEEGTPDVYRNLIDKLKQYGSLDEIIVEPLSMDWRAEQILLPKLKQQLETCPQYLPRAGEIVLFLRNPPVRTVISFNGKSPCHTSMISQ
jgi:hypothetical protein